MRRPMEEMYGAQYFGQTWERWVDGISHFRHNPQGETSLSLGAGFTCMCTFRLYVQSLIWLAILKLLQDLQAKYILTST